MAELQDYLLFTCASGVQILVLYMKSTTREDALQPVRKVYPVQLLLSCLYHSQYIVQSRTRSPSTAVEKGAGDNTCLHTSVGTLQKHGPKAKMLSQQSLNKALVILFYKWVLTLCCVMISVSCTLPSDYSPVELWHSNPDQKTNICSSIVADDSVLVCRLSYLPPIFVINLYLIHCNHNKNNN